MDFYTKELIEQKADLNELYEMMYSLEESLKYAKENDENAEKIYMALVDIKCKLKGFLYEYLFLNIVFSMS